MRNSWPLILALSGAALSACATPDPLTAPPDWMDIRILEELRVYSSLANPTGTSGEFVIKGAPKVETRSVACKPIESGPDKEETYTCTFEARVKPKDGKAPRWEKRSEKLYRDWRGNWQFTAADAGGGV
jgi:hypothetical protein